MISVPDRAKAVELIERAVSAGARRKPACELLGVSVRTVQRWTAEGDVKADARPTAIRPVPSNKLTVQEREEALAVCHEPRYASLPPTQIVPREADEGRYKCSERTLYRILHQAGEVHHRGRARAPRNLGPARSHLATAPNQVWSWDVTWLPGPARGSFFYLYVIMDVFSRKAVAAEVYDCESGENASALVRRAVLSEHCVDTPLVLHADNGSPQKSSTLRATLEALGIQPSYSRPHVSDDNAFIEALFRTGKYRPSYPRDGFACIEAARHWVMRLFDWYNNEHRHRNIRFVTPAQRHAGDDVEILARRDAVYRLAREQHPERWSGSTRNWSPITEVWLNRPKELSNVA